MAKDKPNLTVVPILNKQLKPKRDYRGKDAYQLYLRVFIGSKHTHMPISIADPHKRINTYVTEQEFTLIEEDSLSTKRLGTPGEYSGFTHIVQEIETRINRLWDFHHENGLPELKLAGLSKKLRYLYAPLTGVIAQDVFYLVRDWLIDNTILNKLLLNEAIFKEDKSFEEAFEDIIGQYCNSVIVFPPKILQDIEFVFLLKAYSSELGGYADVYSVLVLDVEDNFDEYLDKHGEDLFNKDAKLRLPLRNKYSRFVSLFPPSADKSLYINKMEIARKKIFMNYKEKLT